MSAKGQAGVVLYVKDIERVAQFYAQVLGLLEQNRLPGWVALASATFQLELHAIPAEIAERIHISTPPQRREDVALKFFVSVPSLQDAGARASSLGGAMFHEAWTGPGYSACNAMDCEGNVFQLREDATALV
ncbi:VOC family protein [Comamonas koreensis]|uniref:Glyoxalase/bleomycin resistance/dioxygenase family protein n=1 Tax=Comamonas koreensis TaxID=160825 RepID=A0AAW4Y419_9BURK|nr:VOC family protein [Comamonas koreensis]MCD2167909.1 glyoxalase/bleomycin resistance/dioxygenase family protein [Comamonas koreensis]